jgi:3-dehydroquinate dehydratase II
MSKILIINGPNLNRLGKRETTLYGNKTLDGIIETLKKEAGEPHLLKHCQSNAEHVLIDFIHEHYDWNCIIINPAAFTHTSIALRDAILATDFNPQAHIETAGKILIEVHISNIFKRESFRRHSYFSDIAHGVISGLGHQGYSLALQHALKHLPTT